MDLANRAAKSVNYRGFSDKELLALYCADTEKNRDAAGTLGSRYEGVIQRTVRKQRRVCPDGADPSIFLEDVFSLVQINFLRRISGFSFDGPFEAFLYKLVETSALDECRKIIGRKVHTDEPAQIEPEEPASEQPTAEWAQPTERRGGIRDARLLLNEERATPVPQPDRVVMSRERKKIVLDLLLRHALESARGLESSQIIRLHYFNYRSVAEIAVHRFGKPVSARDQEAKEKRIRTCLKSDYRELQPLLVQTYGIRSFREM